MAGIASIAVGMQFKADDKVSAALENIGKKADVVATKIGQAFDKGSKSAKKFGSVAGGVLKAGVVAKGAGAAKSAIRSIADEFIGYDDAIVSASAKFKDLDVATEAGRLKMQELRNTAQTVGRDTEFSAAKAAAGLEFLAMAGFSADQSMAALPGAVDLATNAKLELARATDIVSDSLGSFGLMTEDSTKLTKNLDRVNDVFAKTMTRTNVDMETLFESVKKGAPTFTSTGQSIETFNALIGTMANSGIKGEEAGTLLRNTMLRLANPTKEAQQYLDAIGVTVADEQGNFRDIVDILGDFEQGLKGVGDVERAAALDIIFGKKAISGANVIFDAGTDSIRSFREELQKSGGASKTMAAHIRTSIGPQLEALRSAAVGIGLAVFEAFRERGLVAIKKFTEALKAFDIQPLIKGIELAVNIFTGMFKVIKFLMPLFPVLTSYLVSYLVVTKSIAAFNAVKYFFALAKAIKGATIAQQLLNIAMAMNPIGLAVAAVTALIFGLWKLVKHWDKVKGFFKAIGGFFGFKGKDKDIKNTLGNTLSDRKVGAEELKKQGLSPVEPAAVSAAPNSEQVAAVMRNDIKFDGQLNIAGAPPGSTIKSETRGAPPINVALLGANP